MQALWSVIRLGKFVGRPASLSVRCSFHISLPNFPYRCVRLFLSSQLRRDHGALVTPGHAPPFALQARCHFFMRHNSPQYRFSPQLAALFPDVHLVTRTTAVERAWGFVKVLMCLFIYFHVNSYEPIRLSGSAIFRCPRA